MVIPLCRVLGGLRPLRCTAMYRAAASLNVMDCVLARAAASAPGIAARSVNVIIKQLVARGRLRRGAREARLAKRAQAHFPSRPMSIASRFGCVPADRFGALPALPVRLISRIITGSAGQLKKSEQGWETFGGRP